MKLRICLASGILLALGGAIVYTLSQREGGFAALAARAQAFVAKLKEQANARCEHGDAATAQVSPAAAPQEALTTPQAVPVVAPQEESTAVAEPQAAESEPVVEQAPEPAEPARPVSEPAPEPQPAPLPATPAPAPAPAKAPYVPDPRYGRPGEGHEPEKYPAEFEQFCSLLDVEVKQNSYEFGPAVLILLEATNDEFALSSWMQAAAERGNAAAILYLADEVLRFVPADEKQSEQSKRAYARVKQAADMGYVPAMCFLHDCLYNGIGVVKDEAKAGQALMEACKSGEFMPRLRWLVKSKRLTKFADCERKEVKAEIDRGNYHVVYHLAMLAPDDITRTKWCKKAAVLGSANAFHHLALASFRTKPQDGYELLKAAAQLHHPDAYYRLGSMHLPSSAVDSIVKSLSLEPNEANAVRLLKTGAALHSPLAVYLMGSLYYNGLHGMPQDKQLAYRHFSQALALQSPELASAMGLMLLRGEGVEQDTQRGLRLIALAANRQPYAISLLAYAYYKGLGVEKDFSKATSLLQDAGANGMPHAYIILAYITSKGGDGREPNQRMAEHYMRMVSPDLGESAKELYAELEAEGDWEPRP